ncbi:uncharacterized protein LOC131695751 [Topomyia yanbarensis]|uniref:uncharacterized protein LOC131695751 n=1 Tax=Topomyia yanbarensis TaxID=2498891 RepID=UPI00273A8D71|nr:uncharacterized protein LOC131695751 [Topomyia yanbarensis]
MKHKQFSPAPNIPSCSSEHPGPTSSSIKYDCSATTHIRDLLEQNAKSRKILYTKLDANIIPLHTELLSMVRIIRIILCNDLVSSMLNDNIYPTTNEKKELACKIISVFPILTSTKISENAPDYSLFFWKNSGKGPGHAHSGLIHTHLRNACKLLSPSKKKHSRRPKTSKASNVSSEIISLSEECAQLEATPANFNNISKLMADAQPFHNLLINGKKTVTDILNVLPHYKSYNGAMIRKAYERMNPNYDAESDLKKVLCLGLILEGGTFKKVQDDHVRGCLRIMAQLSRKGVRKPRIIMPLEVEEELAAPLIRWIGESPSALAVQLGTYAAYAVEHGEPVPPHIVNQGDVFMMFVQGHIISLGTNSVQAIDTFVKSFCVFNCKVPATIIKLVELIEVLSYKVKNDSSRLSVNQLVHKMRESITAHDL